MIYTPEIHLQQALFTYSFGKLTLNTTAANIRGDTIPANLLHIPIILILLAALSIGPIIVMYGLAADCKIVKPAPITNRPVRKIPYVLLSVAGIS
jgi:hypothetical protein